jgi:hypothetical protein
MSQLDVGLKGSFVPTYANESAHYRSSGIWNTREDRQIPLVLLPAIVDHQ